MLVVMLWDDEQKQKTRVEEKLRKKKEARRGEKLKPPALPDNASVEDHATSEELLRQTELINAQQTELLSLKHLLVQQGKVLQQILEKQPAVIEVPATRIEKEIRVGEKDLPSLQEINVNVIHTEGIETTGKAGEETTEGQSIKDRASKLRALIQRGKE